LAKWSGRLIEVCVGTRHPGPGNLPLLSSSDRRDSISLFTSPHHRLYSPTLLHFTLLYGPLTRRSLGLGAAIIAVGYIEDDPRLHIPAQSTPSEPNKEGQLNAARTRDADALIHCRNACSRPEPHAAHPRPLHLQRSSPDDKELIQFSVISLCLFVCRYVGSSRSVSRSWIQDAEIAPRLMFLNAQDRHQALWYRSEEQHSFDLELPQPTVKLAFVFVLFHSKNSRGSWIPLLKVGCSGSKPPGAWILSKTLPRSEMSYSEHKENR